MVASWFVYLMYTLIACACALLIPTEVTALLVWFGRLQMRPSVQVHLKKIVALEILSFVSLFGIGAVLLEYHRFVAAIVVFSAGTIGLAVSFLLAALGHDSKIVKAVAVVLVYVAAIVLCEYLMGIVEQAEDEYNAAVIAKAVEIPASTRSQRRPKEHEKDIEEQHETKDRISVNKNYVPGSTAAIMPESSMDSATLAHEGLITGKLIRIMANEWVMDSPAMLEDTPAKVEQKRRILRRKVHITFVPLMKRANKLSAIIVARIPPEYGSHRKDEDKEYADFFRKALNGYDYDSIEADKSGQYLIDISNALEEYYH